MSGIPAYQVFALNLNDLTDKIAPVTVAASHTLSDGTTYNFNAQFQRQRAALLESSGIIYAGFASFCDFAADQSRGWLLGWQASTLAPLAANRLTDTLPTGSFFLSAIWMSGYGIAAAPNSGNLFFSTGNSGPGTYDGVRNIQESVVKRGFWREAQRVQEKRIWASLPSSLRIAWKGVLKPRHFLGVRLAVMTMSWISSSDRRSMSM